MKSGQLSGYAGDVWNVQPAPEDHVWRTMKNPLGAGNGMVPHYSGTTLDAQARYANGTKSILKNYINDDPQEPQNIIVGVKGYESKACMSFSPLYTNIISNSSRDRWPALIQLVLYPFQINCVFVVALAYRQKIISRRNYRGFQRQ